MNQARLFHEVAILPSVFGSPDRALSLGDYSDLRQLLSDLRVASVVADLDFGNWHRAVSRALESNEGLTFQDRERISALLEWLQRNNRLVTFPKRGAGDAAELQDWLDLISDSDETNPVDWAISDSNCEPPLLKTGRKCISVRQVLQNKIWERRNSLDVQLCDNGMRDILRVLLKHAGRVDVIDPYLNPDNGNTARFLRICQELTGTSRHSVAHPLVQIHTSIGNKPIEQLDKICESWIKRLSRQASLSGSGIAFRVYIYEKDYMHDRFLLTDQDLGIQSGHGFASAESQQGAKLTTWNLLDPEVVHARRIDFNPQLAASRILATLPST